MGLIARALEESGIATLSLSSARDITRAVCPPRAVYLDYPLGHTSGRAHDPQLNAAIMADTLAAFEALTEPGSMAHLRYRWAQNDAGQNDAGQNDAGQNDAGQNDDCQNDDWKKKVFAPIGAEIDAEWEAAANSSQANPNQKQSGSYEDDRTPRHDTPQYQTQLDADEAAQQHAGLVENGEQCLVCAGIDY